MVECYRVTNGFNDIKDAAGFNLLFVLDDHIFIKSRPSEKIEKMLKAIRCNTFKGDQLFCYKYFNWSQKRDSVDNLGGLVFSSMPILQPFCETVKATIYQLDWWEKQKDHRVISGFFKWW